jgi:hypothetical protein
MNTPADAVVATVAITKRLRAITKVPHNSSVRRPGLAEKEWDRNGVRDSKEAERDRKKREDRERERQRQSESESQRDRESQRERARERERERESQRERQKEKGREKETQRESHLNQPNLSTLNTATRQAPNWCGDSMRSPDRRRRWDTHTEKERQRERKREREREREREEWGRKRTRKREREREHLCQTNEHIGECGLGVRVKPHALKDRWRIAKHWKRGCKERQERKERGWERMKDLGEKSERKVRESEQRHRQKGAAERSSRKEQQKGATERSNRKEQQKGAAERSSRKEQQSHWRCDAAWFADFLTCGLACKAHDNSISEWKRLCGRHECTGHTHTHTHTHTHRQTDRGADRDTNTTCELPKEDNQERCAKGTHTDRDRDTET